MKVSLLVRLGFLDVNGEDVQDNVLVGPLVAGLEDFALTSFCGDILCGEDILVGETEDSLDPGLNTISV